MAFNICLLLFFVSLIIAGYKRSYWMYVSQETLFSEMQDSLVPYYIGFFAFGIGIFVSLGIVAMSLFRILMGKISEREK